MRTIAAAVLLLPSLAWAAAPAPEGAAPGATGDEAPAAAAAPGAPALDAPDASAPPRGDGPLPRVGLFLEGGVPDGAVLGLAFRVADPIRLSIGGAYDYVGYGVRAGLAWTPVRWAVSPVLSVSYGRYFDADLTWLADRTSSVPAQVRPLLKQVGFNYASAQLGIELGSPRSFSFTVRGGLSYFWTTIHGASSSVDPGTGVVVDVADPRLRATLPTVDVGLLYWF